MDFLLSLLPKIEHLGLLGYWLIFLISFAESFAFLGEFVPGGIFVMLAGFLSTQGYLDLGDLIWFTAIGAIAGDGLSYWLGGKGTRFFRNENKILKLSHLEKGERFFKKYGDKSILLGRFIGPMRPIVPFVAGLFRMDWRKFFFWNIISGFLWAVGYLLLGYFFGGAAKLIETWATRAGLFVFVVAILIVALWFTIKKSRPVFMFFSSVCRSVWRAVIRNSGVRKMRERHPQFFAFLERRFKKGKFSGLPLTLAAVAFIYVAILFSGIVEDVITSDPITVVDVRFANFLYVFRDSGLTKFFSWATLLGGWQVAVGVAVVLTVFLWIWRRRVYLLPFWATLLGSEAFNLVGKLAFHRPRPETAVHIESGFSFPSGHATIAVALYGFLTYILLRELKTWRRRTAVLLGGLFIILLIGLSRLYLGVHFLSDVWGGYLSGLLVLIVGIALAESLKSRRSDDPENGEKLVE